MRSKKQNVINIDWKIRRRTKLNSHTPFNVREAYKITRTNIMFSLAEDKCRIIALSSAYPGEGKTTTCVNLALSFAQMGQRVLIIDGDLRKPQIHNLFNIDNQVGLSNVLSGMATLKEALHTIENESITVITSGHIPPNPAELLASTRMKELLEKLSKLYDYIFIDTPPINMVTDAVTFSDYISGLILVTRQNNSTHKDVENALNRLALAKVKLLGFILTGDKRTSKGYGKYSKYGKYKTYTTYG